MQELWRLGACEALAGLAAGAFRPSELWGSCLARISQRDEKIQAFEVLADFGAERPAVTGPLAGLPVGVKDIVDTIDLPTCYGSPIYAGFYPPRDAFVAAVLRRAGARIVGKTVTTEFAGPEPSRTGNPHNPIASPGGSSAGSAAAVASGMVPFAIGTQTAGSVIRPAAFCGVVGFKPSFGLIDITGIRPAAGSLDTVGVFARSVADAGLLASVLAGWPALAQVKPAEGALRVGLWHGPEDHCAQPAILAARDAARAILEKDGVEVVDIDPPDVFDMVEAAARTVLAAETWRSTASELVHYPERVSKRLREITDTGEKVSWEGLAEARQRLSRASKTYEAMVAERRLQAVMVPAAADEAPARKSDGTGDPVFNRVWTALGVPAITLPLCHGGRGLPIGVQFVGTKGGDHLLLSLAQRAEAAITSYNGAPFPIV